MPDDTYRIEVDLDKLTFRDFGLNARFARMLDNLSKVSDDESEQSDAINEMIARFDEMESYLDRVAIVMRNGERIAAGDIPQSMTTDVLAAIRQAQDEARNPGN